MMIREDETLDDLQLNGFQLIQKKKGFRLCLDSVLLADFARIRPRDHVADLGTGTGVLPLLLLGRNKGQFFWGIEIQPDLADVALRNAQLNHLEAKIQVLCCSVSETAAFLPPRSMDAVVCNPPYPRKTAASSAPEEDAEEKARHQGPEEMQAFLAAARWLLREKGKLFLVYPAGDMLDLMEAMRREHLEPKRFRLVYPFADRAANLVLIEGISGGKPALQTMPPLIIHAAEGHLTNELKSIYHMNE